MRLESKEQTAENFNFDVNVVDRVKVGTDEHVHMLGQFAPKMARQREAIMTKLKRPKLRKNARRNLLRQLKDTNAELRQIVWEVRPVNEFTI